MKVAINLFLLCGLTAYAVEVLPVSEVLSMAQAGLSEDLILAKIRKAGGATNLTTPQIIQLKKAGLSDTVIKALMDPSAAPAAVPAAVAATGYPLAAPTGNNANVGNPNDPQSPHESGIYLYTKDREGKPQMIALERAACQGSKTGGVFTSAMTYGIKKVKTKAVIPGPRAGIRAQEPSPVFYFYFEDKAAGLGKGLLSNLSSPNQFALVRLDVNKNNRETVIMEASALGASTGTDSKALVGFKSERIRPGVYRVTVNGNLSDGEYCFLAGLNGSGIAGAAFAVDIFDFSMAIQ